MDEKLTEFDRELMLEFFGEIVTKQELEEYLKWLQEQRRMEEETLRSVTQPC